jgi:hypothetical protein
LCADEERIGNESCDDRKRRIRAQAAAAAAAPVIPKYIVDLIEAARIK